MQLHGDVLPSGRPMIVAHLALMLGPDERVFADFQTRSEQEISLRHNERCVGLGICQVDREALDPFPPSALGITVMVKSPR